MSFTFAYYLLWLATFLILFRTYQLYARLENKNQELEKRNLQLESHNSYLVARYGVEQTMAEVSDVKVLACGGSLKVTHPKGARIKNLKVYGEVEPVEEDYTDGAVQPGQYLDRELEWNRETIK